MYGSGQPYKSMNHSVYIKHPTFTHMHPCAQQRIVGWASNENH